MLVSVRFLPIRVGSFHVVWSIDRVSILPCSLERPLLEVVVLCFNLKGSLVNIVITVVLKLLFRKMGMVNSILLSVCLS